MEPHFLAPFFIALEEGPCANGFGGVHFTASLDELTQLVLTVPVSLRSRLHVRRWLQPYALVFEAAPHQPGEDARGFFLKLLAQL